MNPWESRRETTLDLFGKAKPFAMTPALQIDRQNARLLVEALSGRWCYDTQLRDKRDAWYYVANAFSLCVDRIAPGVPSGGDDYEVLTNWNHHGNGPDGIEPTLRKHLLSWEHQHLSASVARQSELVLPRSRYPAFC